MNKILFMLFVPALVSATIDPNHIPFYQTIEEEIKELQGNLTNKLNHFTQTYLEVYGGDNIFHIFQESDQKFEKMFDEIPHYLNGIVHEARANYAEAEQKALNPYVDVYQCTRQMNDARAEISQLTLMVQSCAKSKRNEIEWYASQLSENFNNFTKKIHKLREEIDSCSKTAGLVVLNIGALGCFKSLDSKSKRWEEELKHDGYLNMVKDKIRHNFIDPRICGYAEEIENFSESTQRIAFNINMCINDKIQHFHPQSNGNPGPFENNGSPGTFENNGGNDGSIENNGNNESIGSTENYETIHESTETTEYIEETPAIDIRMPED